MDTAYWAQAGRDRLVASPWALPRSGEPLREGDPKAVGFDGRGESLDIAERLEGWQRAGDDRIWKLIVSPEFGDRADLKRLTRDLVSRMERDLTPLEWVAAARYNTGHPHVHIAVRGTNAEGRPLRLSQG